MTNLGENGEKLEPLYSGGGDVQLYSNCGKEYSGFSKN